VAVLHILFAVGLMLSAVMSPLAAAGADTIVVRPATDNSMLVNPGKGYVQYYGTDDKYTEDYIGVVYTRWPWNGLEPKEGVYRWDSIDQFIAQAGKYGKKTAIGVMSVSTGLGQHVTPKWVFNAGARSMEAPDPSSPTGTQLIPESWEDPVFLAKMKAFIAAFGKRYDGNPNLAFVDIRDYGNWGEGHIGMLGHNPKLILTPAESLQNNYLLPYFKAFPHTQLVVVWGSSMYDKPYDWAVSKGAGMRRDGILSEYSKDGSECLRAYGHAPAVFEYCYGYDETKKKGYWSTESLWHYVDCGRPTYMQWNPEIYEENKEFFRKLGNRVGYHFVLEEAQIPAKIVASVSFSIKLKWRNDGVAPVYEPCHVAIALLDSKDHFVQKQWLKDSNPRSWKPEESTTEMASTTFSAVPPETCKLAVGLFLNRQDTNPAYRLGIMGRTADGWYVLSDKLRSVR
jgi:hypothetical protein